jgi:pyruvate dehydrogenase E1 component beta subunit
LVDGGWKSFGVTAEMSALISENIFECLKSPIIRVTLPDTPAPASSSLEKAYYPTVENITQAVRRVLGKPN